eukprot:1973688-Prymnesium_polylepis.1
MPLGSVLRFTPLRPISYELHTRTRQRATPSNTSHPRYGYRFTQGRCGRRDRAAAQPSRRLQHRPQR